MRQNDLLSVTAILSVLLLALHISQGIVSIVLALQALLGRRGAA